MSEHQIEIHDIMDINVVVSSFNRMLCEPREIIPREIIDAKFSILFVVATAIYYQSVGLEHFTQEKLQNEEVLQLAGKITHQLDPDLSLKDATRGFLKIRTMDHKTHSKQVDKAYGHPDNPIKKDDLVKKFMDCVDKAVKKIPGKHLEKALEYLMNLEEILDIREIMTCFSGKNSVSKPI